MSFLNLDLESYYKTLNHMKVTSAEEGDGTESPVKVDVIALRALLQENLQKAAVIYEEIPQEPINCGFFLIDASYLRASLTQKYKVSATTLVFQGPLYPRVTRELMRLGI